MVNSSKKKALSQPIARSLSFVSWDMVPTSLPSPFLERFRHHNGK